MSLLDSLKEGEPVEVWPFPGKRVQAHPQSFGRFVKPEGEKLPYSAWLLARISDGSLLLSDPRENLAHGEEVDVAPEVSEESVDANATATGLAPGEPLAAVGPVDALVNDGGAPRVGELAKAPKVIHLEPPAETAEKSE
jgi:hypothetical protein